jgi:ADP-ribosylglycohydrolase
MNVKQAQAILMGLALGDSLGAPVEFMSIHEIKRAYGQQGIQSPRDPALYTDDTQMTVALTEALLDAGLNANLDDQMNAVGKWFIRWRDHEPPRAPGRTCLAGVANFERGVDWRQAGIAESKGCGSAMRVATIGYLYQHDERRLYEVAHASGLITHRHPAAIAASLAGAYLVKLALDGVHPRDYMRLVMQFCDGVSDEFDAAILRIGHTLGWINEEASLKHIGEGWVGEEAIALALYCILRNPDDYEACVCRAANTNGDSDSIACIAGGIMGARLGSPDAMPQMWIDCCENRDYLLDLGEKMANARRFHANL